MERQKIVAISVVTISVFVDQGTCNLREMQCSSMALHQEKKVFLLLGFLLLLSPNTVQVP